MQAESENGTTAGEDNIGRWHGGAAAPAATCAATAASREEGKARRREWCVGEQRRLGQRLEGAAGRLVTALHRRSSAATRRVTNGARRARSGVGAGARRA
jgi:hypothetical protein